MAAKVVVATQSSVVNVDGRERLVYAGERYSAAHPVVRAHAHLFEAEAEAGVQRPRPPRRRRTKAA